MLFCSHHLYSICSFKLKHAPNITSTHTLSYNISLHYGFIKYPAGHWNFSSLCFLSIRKTTQSSLYTFGVQVEKASNEMIVHNKPSCLMLLGLFIFTIVNAFHYASNVHWRATQCSCRSTTHVKPFYTTRVSKTMVSSVMINDFTHTHTHRSWERGHTLSNANTLGTKRYRTHGHDDTRRGHTPRANIHAHGHWQTISSN